MEGKTAREAASELAKERVSNEREHMSQCGQRASFNRRPRGASPLQWMRSNGQFSNELEFPFDFPRIISRL